MTTWRRHNASRDSKWHAGDEVIGSFVTQCNGRWSISDELAGEVEHSDSPPQDERCEVCQRARIDIVRVEQGLRELRESATHTPHHRSRVVTWPFDLSDVHGGES